MSDENKGFFQELKRRNVYRVATVYAIAGWLLIQVADVTFPYLGLPEWPVTVLIVITLAGFPIAMVLAWFFEMSPGGIVRTGSKKADDNPYPDRKKKPLTSAITIGVLLLLLAGQFIYFFFLRNPANEAQAASTSSLSFPSNSIAVLPFVNMSEEKDNQYFSDGVMEAILNNLCMIHDLKVVSRTSVEKYRNPDKNIGEIAKELEVANILEGSVQRIGDQVRVTAQLISVENDEHLWADSYDRQLTDIFAIQSEVAQTIAENLEVIMTTDELELIRNAPTSNLIAYDILLKVWEMESNSEEVVLEKIKLSERAIELDPEFGLAYGTKGSELSKLAYFGYPEALTFDSAMKLMDLCIELAPDEWIPYMIRANLHFRKQEQTEAVKNIRKSLEINPNNSWGSDMLGKYLLSRDDYEKGIDYMLKGASLNGGDLSDDEYNLNLGFFLIALDKVQAHYYFMRSIELNPENSRTYEQLISTSMYLGDYDQMLRSAEKFRELRPGQVNTNNLLAQIHMIVGNFDKSETIYEESLGIISEFENDYMVYPFKHRLGYAKMKNGREAEGVKLLEAYRDTLFAAIQRKEARASAFGDYYDLALIYSVMDQKEEALNWLRKARDNRSKGAFYPLTALMTDPMLDNLRDEPDFQALLEESKREEEEITRIFHQKLKEYHARKELKWLKAG